MNATFWNYFVSYETDISVALERLREDVFVRGDYKCSVETRAPALVAHAGSSSYQAESESRVRDFPPRSIGELLNRQGRNGTHSILDITSLFPRPRPGAISPFPQSKLFELFGTDTPGREEIEEAWTLGKIQICLSRRGQGICLIAYRDGHPEEIFFAGCSGG